MSNFTEWHGPSDSLALRVRESQPFYYTTRPSVFSQFSDQILVIFAPIVAYWAYSLFFHALDVSESSWLDKYRIHESAEVKTRNRATRGQVVAAVVLQHVIQALLGWWWMGEGGVDELGELANIKWIEGLVFRAASFVWTEKQALRFTLVRGEEVVWFVYWWAIPLAQLGFAFFIIDTWQYFLHRLFHVNKFLYKQFHQTHHRLYVPYAFGALYNHPLEGFLLDSVGAALAETLCLMSVRQATFLFTFATLKTVDDHCGYRLPFDPLQMVFGNNADYHDIHHQVIGIKSNFSQPFFIHWDTILGTRMTRDELEKKKRR